MEFNLNEKQQAAINSLHNTYKFVRPGRLITRSGMLDLVLAFVERYDNEFEEFAAGAYDLRMSQMIDSHIMREPE